MNKENSKNVYICPYFQQQISMDTKMFLIYLELLKKYNMEGIPQREKKELAKDMELIKNGLLPIKYLNKQKEVVDE